MLVINHVILLGGHVCDRITEKSEKLEMDDLAMDLTTVKALQRDREGACSYQGQGWTGVTVG